MKKLTTLFLVLALASSNLAAQTQTDFDVQQINLNLDKFHKEYRTGTVFVGIGAAIVLTGIAAISQDSETEPAILYMGGVILSIGTVIHIDSHKFLNPKRRRSK